MVTFIGLIILLVGITLWLLERQNKISERKNEEIRQYNENRDSYGRRQLKSTFDVPVKWHIPTIVSNSGGNSGGGALQTLELKMLHDLSNDIAKGKTKK
jgi:hypothetical protein